jgi:hypothetical protein
MKKTLIAALICSASVVGVSAGSAFAGEYNGRGETGVPGAENGKSDCSYSGKDIPDNVENNPQGRDDDSVTAVGNTRVQSYGMYVRAGKKGDVPSPGVACSPGRP